MGYFRNVFRKPAPASPFDFSLPEDQGDTFIFDRAFRKTRNTVLVWYRGHW